MEPPAGQVQSSPALTHTLLLPPLQALARPSRGRLVVGVTAAAPRSGDGGGEQRPSLRRPKPRQPPPPADEVRPELRCNFVALCLLC